MAWKIKSRMLPSFIRLSSTGNRGNDYSSGHIWSGIWVLCNFSRSSTYSLLYTSVSRSQNVTIGQQLFLIFSLHFKINFVLLFDGLIRQPVKTVFASWSSAWKQMNHLQSHPHVQDAYWISTIRSGGAHAETAIRELYLTYKSRVTATLVKLIAQHEEVKVSKEDLLHDSFIVLIRKLEEDAEEPDSLCAYWKGIAKNYFSIHSDGMSGSSSSATRNRITDSWNSKALRRISLTMRWTPPWTRPSTC